MANQPRPSEPTLHDYVRTLRRLFLVEDQDGRRPTLRSSRPSRGHSQAAPRGSLIGRGRAGSTPDRLLGPEIEWAGFLFESQVIHDLRVYAEPHRAAERFYRDNKGLEVDAVIDARDGSWFGAEVKLGPLDDVTLPDAISGGLLVTME